MKQLLRTNVMITTSDIAALANAILYPIIVLLVIFLLFRKEIYLRQHFSHDADSVKDKLWTIASWLFILLDRVLGFIVKGFKQDALAFQSPKLTAAMVSGLNSECLPQQDDNGIWLAYPPGMESQRFFAGEDREAGGSVAVGIRHSAKGTCG